MTSKYENGNFKSENKTTKRQKIRKTVTNYVMTKMQQQIVRWQQNGKESIVFGEKERSRKSIDSSHTSLFMSSNKIITGQSKYYCYTIIKSKQQQQKIKW